MQGKDGGDGGGEAKISEAEAQLYDRQIRLWGLDAQKRLRASRVLVAGVRGMTVEVAKNLVLAGVASLRIVDHNVLGEEDAAANYLAPRDKVGQNRAEASLARLQALNPMVAVTAGREDLSAALSDLSAYDVVVAASSCYPREVLAAANTACRKSGAKFYCGDVYGFFGYSFMDLCEHSYVEEVAAKPPPKKEDNGAEEGGTPAKKAKIEVETVPEATVVKKTMKFAAMEDTLAVDWSSKNTKRTNFAFFLLHVLMEFHSRESRAPSTSSRDADLELLSDLRRSVTSKFGLADAKIPESALTLLFSERSSAAAVVGGKLAQEVIKAISNRDAPHANYFLFNPVDGAGVVEAVACC